MISDNYNCPFVTLDESLMTGIFSVLSSPRIVTNRINRCEVGSILLMTKFSICSQI